MKRSIPMEEIRLYCENNKNIVMAFIFGSYASGYACSESDVDIAVYLIKEDRSIESQIQTDLERIIKKEVDLVILNRCSAILAWAIFSKGAPIIIKDRGKYIDFMLDVSSEAEDFLDFSLDTYRRKYAVRETG